MNLLRETVGHIVESGHTPDDIIFVGSEKSGHQCTWAEFQVLADVEYSSGFGAAEVAQDLIIVFRDGQKMWRGEYDGSEWWEHSTPFRVPDKSLPIHRLIVTKDRVGWCDLAEINASTVDAAP